MTGESGRGGIADGGGVGDDAGVRVTSAWSTRLPRDAKTIKAWTIEHDLLKDYTADGYTAALEALIRKTNPEVVLFPHTYQVRDFASEARHSIWTSVCQRHHCDANGRRRSRFRPAAFSGKAERRRYGLRRRTSLRIDSSGRVESGSGEGTI